ncbi:MAG: hypothetical protein IPM64_03145 [Phycisphaerales bacterium]|nr:hypothetical protein [Phycisphaerales bacterium]
MNPSAEHAQACTLDPFSRAQVLVRLRDALDVAESASSDDSGALLDLLDDLRDRVRAWSVAGSAPAGPAPAAAPQSPAADARPHSRCTSVLSSAEPVTEFLLLPFGFVQVDGPLAGRDFEFTRRHALGAVRWFERIGRKLAIDYEHQSLDGRAARDDGLRPAAGWISRLDVREDGLWATGVTWTARATELLRSGEYRYFSPVIYWTDREYTDVAALGPVALTNDPALCGVAPLTAGRATGPAADADPQTQIAALRAQLTAHAADAFIAEGLRSGRIVESTRADWREDYLRDPQRAAERLSRAPVVLAPGRVIRPGVLPAPVVSPQERGQGIEPQDMEAFDRAAAAGRVRIGSAPGA